MKTQFRDPAGMLNCLHNVVSNESVFFLLLEACEAFDPCMIRRNQVVSPTQKSTLLELAKYPLTLKKQIRLYMRKAMGSKLLNIAGQFDIPTCLKKYLCFDYSWGFIGVEQVMFGDWFVMFFVGDRLCCLCLFLLITDTFVVFWLVYAIGPASKISNTFKQIGKSNTLIKR